MRCTGLWLVGAMVVVSSVCFAQDVPPTQSDFPPDEFAARRDQVFDHIGDGAVALIQGAAAPRGISLFRQSNSFYYLCGLEVPHAYLLLDGRDRSTTLFLPHLNPDRERHEGRAWSVEDADSVKALTGADAVMGVERLAAYFTWDLVRLPAPVLYTPSSPAEGTTGMRDELIGGSAGIASDPWDGRGTREGHFRWLLAERFPQFEVRDLSPILDDLRMIKSPREIELIRQASRLAGLGLMEAMRSTAPGVFEYQLAAAARYIHAINGAPREAYSPIVGGGTNAWFGHYYRNDARLADGDLVLMDYAPEFRFYTSDVTRMWPVNGSYNDDQRRLCAFILEFHRALLNRIRPGVTVDQILDGAADHMRGVLDGITFSKPIYQEAAESAVRWRGHLSHPVGMAVHDVGNYKAHKLEPGMVFAVDPMMWIEAERLYIRIEDVVVVTEDGVENLSAFVPSEPNDIEKLMTEKGVLEKVPPTLAESLLETR